MDFPEIVADRKADWRKIALALIDSVARSRRSITTFVNRVRPLKLTVDFCPASESPLDSCGHVVAQFLRSLQPSLDPDNLHLSGRDLPGRFAVTSRSHQAALMAGQHSPKNRNGAFLRLRMRTAKADQSLRTMLSSGQGAQVRARSRLVK